MEEGVKEKMEIDDGVKVKRWKQSVVDEEEFGMKVRAYHSLMKQKRDRDHQDRLNRQNMTKSQIIKQELFFSDDIDLNRLSLKPKTNKFKKTGKHKIKKTNMKMMCPEPEPAGPETTPSASDKARVEAQTKAVSPSNLRNLRNLISRCNHKQQGRQLR